MANEVKKWKPRKGQTYWFIKWLPAFAQLGVIAGYWEYEEEDMLQYLTNNCFKTEAEAEELLKKIKKGAKK